MPYRDVLATYLRPQRPRLLLLGFVLFAGIGLQLANPQLTRTFIDRARAGAAFDSLVAHALVILAVAVLTQVAMVVEAYVAEDLGWRTTNALRVDLTAHVLTLDESYHAEHGAGELIERIDGDASAIAAFFARFVVEVVGSGVFLLGVLVLLWREDWRIGGLLTIFALTAMTFMARGGGFVGRRARVDREVEADLGAYLEERLSGLVDLKANGADDATMRGLHQHLAARFHSGRRAVAGAALFSSTVNTLFVAATAAALVTAAGLQRIGALTLGAVFLVFRYTGMLRWPLERLSRHMNSFQRATGALVRVVELLQTRPHVVDGHGAALSAGALSVELDGVSFAYDDELVLGDVSVRLEAGEQLGLLGRTGSGKTTIARLLFRLHDVRTGAVRIGGTDVRDLRLADLRDRVGMVTQDVQLFAGTLRDNVRLFDPAISDARLHEVFSALDLTGWLAELSDGLDTVLGPTGRGLSAGEAQLVAFTRVFLKDPGVVVLDEASSRLDPHTEALLERAVDRLLSGRTGIVIAHRLRTVERVDSILILDGGAVVETGGRLDLAGDPDSRFSRLRRAGAPELLS